MLLQENFVSRLISLKLCYDDAHDDSLLATTVLIKSRMKDVGLKTFNVRPSRRARDDIDTDALQCNNSLQNYLRNLFP